MTARQPGVAVLVGAWRGWRPKRKKLPACRAGFSISKILGRSLMLAIAASPILLAASARAAAANDQGGQIAGVCACWVRLDGGEKGIPSSGGTFSCRAGKEGRAPMKSWTGREFGGLTGAAVLDALRPRRGRRQAKAS